jgi:hypothetical protein
MGPGGKPRCRTFCRARQEFAKVEEWIGLLLDDGGLSCPDIALCLGSWIESLALDKGYRFVVLALRGERLPRKLHARKRLSNDVLELVMEAIETRFGPDLNGPNLWLLCGFLVDRLPQVGTPKRDVEKTGR